MVVVGRRGHQYGERSEGGMRTRGRGDLSLWCLVVVTTEARPRLVLAVLWGGGGEGGNGEALPSSE